MTLLLWLLRSIGILLLALLAMLLILLLLPASVWLEWKHEDIRVQVGMLGLRYTVVPGRTKPKKKQKPQPKEKKEEKRTEPSPQKAAKITFEQARLLVSDAGRFLRAVLSALRIKHIRLYLPVSGEDAADTALKYGKMRAWLHGGLGVLNRALWLSFDEFRLEPDYTGKAVGQAYFSCQISAQLIIIGITAVKLLLRLQKQKILNTLLSYIHKK